MRRTTSMPAELVVVFGQVDDQVGGVDVGGHRHHLERAVAGVVVGGHDGRQLGRGPEAGQRVGQPGEDGLAFLRIHDPQHPAVETHHLRHPVVDQHRAVAVEDATPGPLDLDGAEMDPGGGDVLGLVDDLQVPETSTNKAAKSEMHTSPTIDSRAAGDIGLRHRSTGASGPTRRGVRPSGRPAGPAGPSTPFTSATTATIIHRRGLVRSCSPNN